MAAMRKLRCADGQRDEWLVRAESYGAFAKPALGGGSMAPCGVIRIARVLVSILPDR